MTRYKVTYNPIPLNPVETTDENSLIQQAVGAMGSGLESNYQPLDADLTAIAALGYTTPSFLTKTAADTWVLDTNTYSLSSHNHDLVYQPLDSDLTSIAGLGFASTSFLKKTALNTWELDVNTYSLSTHNHSGVYEVAGLMSTHESTYTHANIAHGETAYTWGNHASANYIADGDFTSQGIMLRGASAGTYSILANASTNWNTAYGWGNHASAGYAAIASPTFTGTVTTPSLIVTDLTDGYVPYQKAADDKLSDSPIYIDAVNGIVEVNGSVKLPEYNSVLATYFTDRAATGGYIETSPTNLKFVARNGHIVFDTAAGNVGIGTTAPGTDKLKIQTDGTAINGLNIYSPSTSNGAKITLSDNIYSGFIKTLPSSALGETQLVLGAGSVDAINIKQNGNVGIGTTSPGAQLEVMSITGGTLRLKRDDVSVTTDEVIGTVEFYTNDADGAHIASYIRGLGADLVGQNYGRFGELSFGVSKTAMTDAVEAMRINLSGFVGIGTTAPGEKLEVYGDIKLSDGTDRYIKGPLNNDLYIVAYPNAADEGIKFSTDGGTTTELFLQDGGNVGIGTTSPLSRLSINGGVHVGGDSDAGDNNLLVDGTITSPTILLTTSPTVGYVWACTNVSGAGAWTSMAASQVYKGTVDGDDGKYNGGATALIDGTGTAGWYYRCATDGGTYDYGNPSGNSITLAIGDDIYYNGSVWQKIAGSSYTLPIATADVLGGVKIGTGVSVDAGGVISVSTAYDPSGTMTTHEATYNHDNYDTAYGWGDHDGLYAALAHTLDGHSNVTITGNTDGELLKWNGSAWINNTLAEAGIQATLTPAALTKTDDTNVTLTLGGTPVTSLLQAVSLTLGWTGTLADARIASAATWSGKQDGHANLTSLSGLSYASLAFVKMSSANTFSLDTSTYLTSVSSAALTKTNDTNVTLTLGGSPTTALLQATSLTLGWTGTLADARIASAVTWNAKQTGHANLTSLSALSYTSLSFVKMSAAGTFSLDTSTYLTSITPAALTYNNDTNVILTLTGTPATALLQAVSINVFWAGTLADARIASSATWNAKQIGHAKLTSLSALTYVSTSFVKLTGTNTFTLDTTVYQPAITPNALSRSNDTNITLTLGGTPLTSLLQAVSITAGWTGTLADARITSAATWNAKQTGHANLTSLAALSYASVSFVKMTAANTFALDTSPRVIGSGVTKITVSETEPGTPTEGDLWVDTSA